MHRQILTVAVVAAVLTSLAFASPQDEKAKKKDADRTLVVQGCVHGSRLDVIHVDIVGPKLEQTTDHFKLRGNKDLMKVLTKDLNGHTVEVTGLLDDPHGTQGNLKTIQVGKKTTITTGSRDMPAVPDPVTDPTLSVTSFRDVDKTCHSGS